jgi:hypothetical protein
MGYLQDASRRAERTANMILDLCGAGGYTFAESRRVKLEDGIHEATRTEVWATVTDPELLGPMQAGLRKMPGVFKSGIVVDRNPSGRRPYVWVLWGSD